MHGLRIRQTRPGGILLTGRIQQLVVGTLSLVNDSAMGVIKAEVSRQEIRSRSSDSARSRAEVEDGLTEIQRPLKRLHCLAEKCGSEQDLEAVGLGDGKRR